MAAQLLLIEDNETNLDLMSYLLGAFGHHVLTARSGVEGLALARQSKPDLILCDVQMRGMDGYEVARQLAADATLAAIPVIAVTALAMVDDRRKVLEGGFDGYISKPIDPGTFVSDVEAFLMSPVSPSAP